MTASIVLNQSNDICDLRWCNRHAQAKTCRREADG